MLTPLSCEEFALRISEGTDKEGTGRTLTAKDFTVLSVSDYVLMSNKKGHGYRFVLNNKKEELSVTISYELAEDESFCHKYLQMPGKTILQKKLRLRGLPAGNRVWDNLFIQQKRLPIGGSNFLRQPIL